MKSIELVKIQSMPRQLWNYGLDLHCRIEQALGAIFQSGNIILPWVPTRLSDLPLWTLSTFWKNDHLTHSLWTHPQCSVEKISSLNPSWILAHRMKERFPCQEREWTVPKSLNPVGELFHVKLFVTSGSQNEGKILLPRTWVIHTPLIQKTKSCTAPGEHHICVLQLGGEISRYLLSWENNDNFQREFFKMSITSEVFSGRNWNSHFLAYADIAKHTQGFSEQFPSYFFV